MVFAAVIGNAAAKTAAGVVNRAITVIENSPSVTADISVSRSGGEKSEGNLILSKEKFRIDFPGVKNWFDGKNMWAYSSSAGEVNLTEPSAEELMEINPLSYITSVRNNFNKRLLKSIDKGISTVELTPLKGKKSDVDKIVASFCETTGFPVKLILYTKGQGVVTVTLGNIRVGKKLPVSTFRFNPAQLPGVEVIDLR